MPWVQLAILQIFFFVGLLFFLRYALTRNITRATGHLEELSKDFAAKQIEIDKRLKEANDEYQNIIKRAKQDADGLRSKLLQEANEQKDKIIQEAHLKSEEMIEKTERTCDFLKKEIDQKVEQKSTEKAFELLGGALPEKFQQELHSLWVKDSHKAEFQLGSLNLPPNIKDVKIVSAFPLTHQQKEDLLDKLRKKLSNDVNLIEETDAKLIAGFVVTIGSLVIDASLRHKIESAIKQA